MGIGVSVFLLAIGAVLAFAVDIRSNGLDLNTVGVILMIVGGIGLAASFLFLNGGGYRRTAVRREVVDEPVVARRGVVRQREIIRDEDVI